MFRTGRLSMAKVNQKSLNFHYTEPIFKIYTFSEVVAEQTIIFQVVKMSNSTLIFVNKKDHPVCNDFVLSLNGSRNQEAISTYFLENGPDNSSCSIAKRISKKLNKVIFFSFNLDEDRLVIPFVQNIIFEHIKNFPEKF